MKDLKVNQRLILCTFPEKYSVQKKPALIW